jgi:hypothetical protein
MSNTSPKDQRALLRNAPKAPPRQPRPGEEVWCLRRPDGRVQTCEIRDDTKAGAGWDVLLLENDEPLFSRRCAFESEARYVAKVFKEDTMRCEWIEAEPKGCGM